MSKAGPDSDANIFISEHGINFCKNIKFICVLISV